MFGLALTLLFGLGLAAPAAAFSKRLLWVEKALMPP
jgi:hypothetical protein